MVIGELGQNQNGYDPTDSDEKRPDHSTRPDDQGLFIDAEQLYHRRRAVLGSTQLLQPIVGRKVRVVLDLVVMFVRRAMDLRHICAG